MYKIVAVDDSPIVLKTLDRVMHNKYDLHSFTNGTRALKFLNEEARKPDLIILDIDMPVINGFEMLEQIKKLKHLEKIPVIFLTSNRDKNYVIKAVTGGAKDYVIKPIDDNILLEKVESLLFA